MKPKTGVKAYRDLETLSQSPAKIVVDLYEHLLVNLRRARMQIEAQNIEGKGTSLGKAGAIVTELTGSLKRDLDPEQGGEFVERLAGLYAFFQKEILEASRANITQAAERRAAMEKLDSMIGMIADLTEAWRTAAAQVG